MLAGIQAKVIGYVVGAVLIALAAWLAYSTVYNRGHEAASLKYEAQIAATAAAIAEADANEQRRQTIANSAAKAREAKAIAEIAAKEDEITELRKELRREAQQDPDAGRIAIGSGGVQRINKVR